MEKQIVIEDTASGREMWKHIIEFLLSNRFNLNPRNGIRGVRNFLEECKDSGDITSKHYFIVVDKVIDNSLVMETVARIENIVSQCSNMTLTTLHSFEQSILSFLLLPEWAQMSDKHRKLVSQFNAIFGKDEYHLDEVNNYSELSLYFDKIIGSSETVASVLLNESTFKTGFRITKSEFDRCWVHDCCGFDDGKFRVRDGFRRNCTLTYTTRQKFTLLVNQSRLKSVLDATSVETSHINTMKSFDTGEFTHSMAFSRRKK